MSSIRVLAATSQPENVLLSEPSKYFPGEEVVKEASRDGIGHYRSSDGGQHRFVLFARGEPVAGLMVDARRKWKGMQSAVVTQSHALPSAKATDPLRSLLNYARSQFRRLIEQEAEEAPEQIRTAKVTKQSFLSKEYSAGESAIVVIRVPPQIVQAEGAGWPKDIMDENGPPHYTIIYAPGPHDDRAKVAIQKAVANVASALTPFKLEMPVGYQEFLTESKEQKVVHKGADPESAAEMENIADALEQELRKEGITPRRFPEFIAHATLAKIPVGQSFNQATPEGSFTVSGLELWGWPETIAFPFGGQSGEAARRLSDALDAAEADASLDKTGGRLRDLALSTAVGLAGVSTPAKLDMPKTQELAPAPEAPKPEYMMPTKFKTPADRQAHERAQSYLEAVYEVSREVGIAPELLDALVWTESKYKPGAKSGVGARGLVQMMPATAKDLEQRLKLPAVDFGNDRSVLRAGAQYLKYLMNKYEDRPNGLQLALAAYNAGEGNVRKHNYKIPPFKETQDYVKRIMERMQHTPIHIPVELYGGLSSPMEEFLYPHRRAMRIAAKDRLPGGLADDASPEDFDPDELALGVKTESEHTTDENLAREIAMDHLTEDPKYYTKLKKFESKASIRISSVARRSSLS